MSRLNIATIRRKLRLLSRPELFHYTGYGQENPDLLRAATIWVPEGLHVRDSRPQRQLPFPANLSHRDHNRAGDLVETGQETEHER